MEHQLTPAGPSAPYSHLAGTILHRHLDATRPALDATQLGLQAGRDLAEGPGAVLTLQNGTGYAYALLREGCAVSAWVRPYPTVVAQWCSGGDTQSALTGIRSRRQQLGHEQARP
jgi:hypothetical protein